MHEFPLIRANHQRISCAEPEWQLQWNPHIRKKIWIKTQANSRKFSNLKWITWSEAGKFEKQTYHLSIGWSGRCHGNGDDEGHERVPIHFKVKVLNDQSTDAEPTDEKWNPQQKGNGKLLRWPTDEDCSWLRRATRAIYREKREQIGETINILFIITHTFIVWRVCVCRTDLFFKNISCFQLVLFLKRVSLSIRSPKRKKKENLWLYFFVALTARYLFTKRKGASAERSVPSTDTCTCTHICQGKPWELWRDFCIL